MALNLQLKHHYFSQLEQRSQRAWRPRDLEWIFKASRATVVTPEGVG
jgi:hypothetical protein